MEKSERIAQLEAALRDLIKESAELVWKHDPDNHPDDYPAIFLAAKALDPSTTVCGIVNAMRESKKAGGIVSGEGGDG
jgi:hypothetical protein